MLQLNSSLEANLVNLRTLVKQQIGTISGKIDAEKLDWVTEVMQTVLKLFFVTLYCYPN